MVGKKGRIVFAVLLLPAIGVALAWCAAALWFDGPSAGGLAGALAVGFPVGCLALLVWLQPLRWAMIAVMPAAGSRSPMCATLTTAPRRSIFL